MNKRITILGIESSCDETSAAVILNQNILSNVIANQTVHEKYGGVVPELASREHQRNIIPVVDRAIKEAKIKKEDISAIAFTQGPGLMGSLIVGTSFAKSFSLGMNIPLINVNHMQGHIMAHFIKKEGLKLTQPDFPFLCLTVSGGHTQIVLVRSITNMEIIGETLDDAAGAFDKSAKIMGLPYPGGPLIDKYSKNGDINKFKFGNHKVDKYNFSYSGIKTSILRLIEKEKLADKYFVKNNLSDLCASIQYTIIDILIKKIVKASNELKINRIAIAGGVSANSYFRKRVKELSKENNKSVYIPPFEFCTDNAAMIAMTGYYKYLNKDFSNQKDTPESRLKL